MKESLNSKFIIVSLALLLFSFLSYSQNDYNIKFKIHDIEDSVVYVKTVYGKETIILDTLELNKDGFFYFNKKGLHQGLAVVCLKHQDLFTFLLDKNKNFEIEISASGENTVKGCDQNDLYLEYQKENSSFRLFENQIKQELKANKQANRDSLIAIYNTQRNRFAVFQQNFYSTYPNHMMSIIVKALEDPKMPAEFYKGKDFDTTKTAEFAYYFRKHYWENFRFDDNRILATPYFFTKLKKYIDEITIQDPDSMIGSLKDFIVLANSKSGLEYSKYAMDYYLKVYGKMPFSTHEKCFVNIVDNIISEQNTPWLLPSEIQELRVKADKIRTILPGNQIKNITEKTLDQKSLYLYNIKNKYTILYFWSAGCESCKKELELLEKFYNEYKLIYDVEIFSVDLDLNIKESINFAKTRPFNWIVTKTTAEDIMEKYGLDVALTPDLYVLDSNKKILHHAAQYQSVINFIKRNEIINKSKNN